MVTTAATDRAVLKHPAPVSRHRFGVVDALRFAAAAAVLLYHFTARNSSAWGREPAEAFPTLHSITAFGAYGVELFFIISGFVILMTAWGKTVSHFAASRIARLYPAYWVAVVLTSLLLLVIWPEAEKNITVSQAAINLTMLQSAFDVSHVDGVYWTLWAELRFYLIIGVFTMLGITLRRVTVFIMLWPVVAAISRTADFGFLSTLLVADYAPLFAGGMAIFCLARHPRSAILWLALAENVLLAAGGPGMKTAAEIADNTGVEIRSLVVVLVVLTMFALVGVATLTRVRSISWRWLTVLGLLTYPVYLVHEYWGWWVITLLAPHASRVVTLLVATVFVLALAWLVHRLVERPLGPRLRSLVATSLEALEPVDRVAADQGPVRVVV